MANRAAQVMTALAAEPPFRTIDGSRFASSKATVAMCTALLFSPSSPMAPTLPKAQRC